MVIPAYNSERVTVEVKEPNPRYYTVDYRPNRGRLNPYPQLTIKGCWLEELGFITGQSIIITTEKGCLIINKITM
ncbi:SymE family type I addiction module toxin [Photorhabdus temperata subsp. temperata]